jgi:UDP-N-acetylglucosamine 2-epimerase (non-hydrolysing)
MQKLKVVTVVGTRPEIIRLSRVMAQLDQYCDHKIIHTGQNYDYELNEVFFKELGIRKPDLFLDAAGVTAAQTIGQIIMSIDGALEKYRPEALLILGDTNSCLAAISAKRRKIPIFHMEAGNRCFDFRVPEEINRKIVDHTSDINLTYSDIAREYLLREGFPPDQIIKTGSPMKEVLDFYKNGIDSSQVLSNLGLTSNDYFVVSSHREENVDSVVNLTSLITTLNLLAERFNKPIIFSTHPRTRKKLESLSLATNSLIQFCKPFGFLDYVKLQCEAICTLSDSGTITEESSILNFPALNLREVHERPEGFEEGAVMMVGNNFNRIIQGLEILRSQNRGQKRDIKIVNDYDVQNVSIKVLRIIQSYTGFVNGKVWKKDSIN